MARPQEQADSRGKLSKKKSRSKQKKASTGKEYVIIAYTFVGIFLALIGYLVYFNIELKDEYANSPYNSKRQGSYQERVVKGKILSADGDILASTETDQEGNEYRLYPYENVFAHVVGYSASGISGLEQSMNSQLLTSHANVLAQVENEFKDEKNVGDNIVTTLDVKLQQAAYDALGSSNGAVVVMEPDTGKILAMVSKPDFDPNTIAADWESINSDAGNSSLVNRATQGLYPPGSTFKIVTALAYWREHSTFDGFNFNCVGEVENGGYTIHCYHNSAHGEEDFKTAFAKSCNSAFAQIGVDLDRSRYRTTVESLLFNQKLPLDDIIYTKSKFSLEAGSADALTMQTAIGQGNTLVTPMHMALITSAVANGGTLMTPYLVDELQTGSGASVKKYKPESYKQLMSGEEASQLSALMKGVVENGTASSLAGRSYTVAGKTGTAEHGDVSSTTPHSWFVGYSNVEDPDIVVCVVAEEAGAGSEVAVPIASRIFEAYYN
jgi:peptidoglycan glycosyltransferase